MNNLPALPSNATTDRRKKVRDMKIKIGTLSVATILIAASFQPAMAGDREWATAGKVLTGIAAGSIIARAFEPRPVVYAAPPGYYATTTVVAAPVYVQPAPVIANAPVVQTAPTYAQQPVVVQQQPAPVYVQPAPVVVYQQPVYVQPAPIYAPVWAYPRPVVSFRFGFGGYGHGGYYGHHGRW
jgi:hypothetical protein